MFKTETIEKSRQAAARYLNGAARLGGKLTSPRLIEAFEAVSTWAAYAQAEKVAAAHTAAATSTPPRGISLREWGAFTEALRLCLIAARFHRAADALAA